MLLSKITGLRYQRRSRPQAVPDNGHLKINPLYAIMISESKTHVATDNSIIQQ